jgi:hypothetical protein
MSVSEHAPNGILRYRVDQLEKRAGALEEQIEAVFGRLNTLIMAVFIAALSISGSFLMLAITLFLTRNQS